MRRADYSYLVYSDNEGMDVLVLTDNGTPGVSSLTNDIEQCVHEVMQKEEKLPGTVAVIYKDSMGNWDGFNPITGEFIMLPMASSDRADDAVAAIREYYKTRS